MISIALWMVALTLSLCLTILSAAAGRPEVHMAVTAIVTLAIAIVAIQSARTIGPGATRSARAANTARYVGFAWIWAGTAVTATYHFILTNWRDSWEFSAGLLLVGGLSVAFASALQRDADAHREDESLLRIARGLNIVQIVGMVVAVCGLVIDQKFPARIGNLRPDWAANDIFFFGALAIACIGVQAWLTEQGEASRLNAAHSG